MLFFVMYDIESNKVRREIAKFLQSKGCVRIQKSIFFASAQHSVYADIHKTIKEVQEFYENKDSIIIVPVSTDEIRSMKIIGQNIDFDIIMNNRNTLFF
ncbi:MAG: CRISPR-associated endonuclease Cas2 [Bacteroidales bacterium]|nr:CRISPR-associated endonuclease Cas2 [Bacteroidales bacterium]